MSESEQNRPKSNKEVKHVLLVNLKWVPKAILDGEK